MPQAATLPLRKPLRKAHPLAATAAPATVSPATAQASRERVAREAEAAIAARFGPPPADLDPDCRTCRSCPHLRHWREALPKARWVARDCWCEAGHDLPAALDLLWLCVDHTDLARRGVRLSGEAGG